MKAKTCMNCKYAEFDENADPCNECECYDNWEPKYTQEIEIAEE